MIEDAFPFAKRGFSSVMFVFWGDSHPRLDIVWELNFLILKVRKLKTNQHQQHLHGDNIPRVFCSSGIRILQDAPQNGTAFRGVRPWSMFKKAKRFATKGRRKGMGGGSLFGMSKW